jgi:hypothetical protein
MGLFQDRWLNLFHYGDTLWFKDLINNGQKYLKRSARVGFPPIACRYSYVAIYKLNRILMVFHRALNSNTSGLEY